MISQNILRPKTSTPQHMITMKHLESFGISTPIPNIITPRKHIAESIKNHCLRLRTIILRSIGMCTQTLGEKAARKSKRAKMTQIIIKGVNDFIFFFRSPFLIDFSSLLISSLTFAFMSVAPYLLTLRANNMLNKIPPFNFLFVFTFVNALIGLRIVADFIQIASFVKLVPSCVFKSS